MKREPSCALVKATTLRLLCADQVGESHGYLAALPELRRREFLRDWDAALDEDGRRCGARVAESYKHRIGEAVERFFARPAKLKPRAWRRK